MLCERIDFLGVPVDILKEEDVERVVMALLETKKVAHIVFLSTWDVLKARRRGEFQDMVRGAALVLPVSKSIIKGAAFIKRKPPTRCNPFNTIISILNVINTHYKSLYLLGGSPSSLTIAEDNVKSTFTELSFVGRYSGYYKDSLENAILSAIVKSHPSLTLIGNGIKGEARWIHRHREALSDGIYIYDPNIIDIFSKHKKKTSLWLFNSGLEYLPKVLKNPLRLFTIFKYLWFKLLLLFYRIRKK